MYARNVTHVQADSLSIERTRTRARTQRVRVKRRVRGMMCVVMRATAQRTDGQTHSRCGVPRVHHAL